jgi:hypothetical protein
MLERNYVVKDEAGGVWLQIPTVFRIEKKTSQLVGGYQRTRDARGTQHLLIMELINAYKILVSNSETKKLLEDLGRAGRVC